MVNLKDKFTAKKTTPSYAPNKGANADTGTSSGPNATAEKPVGKKSPSTSLPDGLPSKKSRPTKQKQTESQIVAVVNQPDSENEEMDLEKSDKEDSSNAGDDYTHPQSPSMFEGLEEESGIFSFYIRYTYTVK